MVSPKYCKFYTKVASNHVDNIESIASNVKFDFLGFTRRVESIIVTAVHGQYRRMWCSSCCCTEKNREWPGHCYNYRSLANGL